MGSCCCRGGQGLEAFGSYDGSRARGLRILQLKQAQIQNALGEKLRTHAKEPAAKGVIRLRVYEG